MGGRGGGVEGGRDSGWEKKGYICTCKKKKEEGERGGEREGGRKRGREGGRERGREGGREKEREGGREGGREGEKERERLLLVQLHQTP